MPLVRPDLLDEMFHPKSIAVIGASSTNLERGWVTRLLNFGYSGNLYPVNPKASEIAGLKAYPTIGDIPGAVDYAIFNIPARLAPQVMEDCIAKGVKFVHIYAAGFAETGKEEAKELEARLTAIIKASNIRVIGPNCMGMYCPRAGLTFNPYFPKEAGNVAFVSQSGAESMRFVFLSDNTGIRFSKVISYGNAIDLDAPDFLNYLANDSETDVIACYIEGIKDGRGYLETIKECLKTKPVIILKAGLTESGAEAAASHTASLAGSEAIWDAFFKQTGAIRAYTMEDVTDVIEALLHMSRPKGRRVALVGRGGGIGVIATDICERAGLKVPAFHEDTIAKLESVIPEAGAGIRNPVETTYGMGGAAEFYAKGMGIVDADPNTDIILTHIAVDVYGERRADLRNDVTKAATVLCDVAKTLTKPLAVALYTGSHAEIVDAVHEAQEMLVKAGIPLYPGVEAASKAINKLMVYHELAERK